MEQYDARLVVKGYAQKEGVDFHKIFSSVVRLTTIRIISAMCVVFDLHLEQLDIKLLFFMANLKKIYIYIYAPTKRFRGTRKRKLGL